MTKTNNRKLKVFLCYASADKAAVRELYKRLNARLWSPNMPKFLVKVTGQKTATSTMSTTKRVGWKIIFIEKMRWKSLWIW